jgi:hypothetical protein
MAIISSLAATNISNCTCKILISQRNFLLYGEWIGDLWIAMYTYVILCIMQDVQYDVHNLYDKLFTIYDTMYTTCNVRCTVNNVRTTYDMNCKMYNVSRQLYA